jgi:uncharacterized membrane protein YccC
MADVNPPFVGLSEHPQAAASIRQIKAWGGLAGFVLVAGYSYLAGMQAPDALLRGIIAGIAGQTLAWIGAIVFWQHMLDAEARAAVKRLVAHREQEQGRDG